MVAHNISARDHGMVKPLDAAKTLCRYLGSHANRVRIQKFLYRAQMIYMGENEGEILIDASFSRSKYGPLIWDVQEFCKRKATEKFNNIFEEFNIVSHSKHQRIFQRMAEENFEDPDFHFNIDAPDKIIECYNEVADALVGEGSVSINIPNDEIMRQYFEYHL